MGLSSKVAYFAGGILFGTAGLKLLSGKEAKKGYVYAAAAGLRLKDFIMDKVTMVQENAEDVMAAAKDLNEEIAAQAALEEEASMIDDETCDECEEICEDDCDEAVEINDEDTEA